MFLFLHLKNIVGLDPWFPTVFEELYNFIVMGNRLLYGVKGKPSRSLGKAALLFLFLIN